MVTSTIVHARNEVVVAAAALAGARRGDDVTQMAFADYWIGTLLNVSEAFYLRWETDAAFYVLRAAAALALTPTQVRLVQVIAEQRRDESLKTADGVTAANSGSTVTIDGPLEECLVNNGYRDSYAALVADLYDIVGWRRNPPAGFDDGFWTRYGWMSNDVPV